MQQPVNSDSFSLRNAGNIHSIGIALLSQNTGIDYTPTSTDRDSVKQLAYLKRRAESNCKGLFLDMVTVPRLWRYHRLKPVVMLQIQFRNREWTRGDNRPQPARSVSYPRCILTTRCDSLILDTSPVAASVARSGPVFYSAMRPQD